MKLHHPETDATVEVPDHAALAVYERSGWTLAPEPEPEVPHVPEGSQLLPDVPPVVDPESTGDPDAAEGDSGPKARKPRT